MRATVFALLLVTACAAGATAAPRASQDATATVPDAHDATSSRDAASDSTAPLDAATGETNALPADASAPAPGRIMGIVTDILADLKHTTYDHTTDIDVATGTFDVDCSGLVNYVLQQAVPAGFAELQGATAQRPLASDYGSFMGALSAQATNWVEIARPAELLPGDIIAWDEPKSVDSSDTGHVMIVVAAPVQATGEVDVHVFDSTDTGHGKTDPRTTDNTTGVGEGTVAVTVDAQGAATGYRWSTENGVAAYKVHVAMGRLQ